VKLLQYMQGEDDDRPNTNQVKVVFIPVVKYKHDRSMQAKLSHTYTDLYNSPSDQPTCSLSIRLTSVRVADHQAEGSRYA
jgi:hypothetical protein